MSPDLPTQLPAHVDNVPLALKGQHVNHKRTTAWISPTPRASNTKIRTLPLYLASNWPSADIFAHAMSQLRSP